MTDSPIFYLQARSMVYLQLHAQPLAGLPMPRMLHLYRNEVILEWVSICSLEPTTCLFPTARSVKSDTVTVGLLLLLLFLSGTFFLAVLGSQQNRRYRTPQRACVASPAVDMQWQSSVLATVDKFILKHRHPKSTVYIRGHPYCWAFHGVKKQTCTHQTSAWPVLNAWPIHSSIPYDPWYTDPFIFIILKVFAVVCLENKSFCVAWDGLELTV